MASLYELKDEILQRTDIVALIGEYVKLKRTGSTYAGRCPFHNDKSPSFYVWPKSQSFFCFGCKKGGDSIVFLMEQEKFSFKESLEFLAKRTGIEYEEHDDPEVSKRKKIADNLYNLNREAAKYFFTSLKSPQAKMARIYIGKRQLKGETVVKFGVGYNPFNDSLYNYLKNKGFSDEIIYKSGLISYKNRANIFKGRLMFPILNENGKIVGFGGRTLQKDGKPKYLNTSENEVFNKRRNLYGLNYSKHSKLEGIILVEGYMDVISLHQAGVDNACASLGTALTPGQINLLKRYTKKVILCYDSDFAGKTAAYRASELMSNEELFLKIFLVPDGKDPDEYIKTHGRGQFLELANNAIDVLEYRMNYLKEKHDLSKDSDKMIYIDEVINEVLLTIEDSIKKDIYIKKVSKLMGVSENALLSKIEIIKDKKKNHNELTEMNIIRNSSNFNFQKYFLRIIIEHPKAYEKVKNQLNEECLTDIYKIIFKIINDLIVSNQRVGTDTIMSKIPVDNYANISNVLADVMSFEFFYSSEDDDKVLKETIIRIQKEFLEKKLIEASKNGDWDAMRLFGDELTKVNNYFSRKE